MLVPSGVAPRRWDSDGLSPYENQEERASKRRRKEGKESVTRVQRDHSLH